MVVGRGGFGGLLVFVGGHGGEVEEDDGYGLLGVGGVGVARGDLIEGVEAGEGAVGEAVG